MNLKQLRLVCEMARNKFNVSQTATSLYTTQPGVSAQIKALEEELNAKLFERQGKRIIGFTPIGEQVFNYS